MWNPLGKLFPPLMFQAGYGPGCNYLTTFQCQKSEEIMIKPTNQPLVNLLSTVTVRKVSIVTLELILIYSCPSLHLLDC